MPPFPTLCRPRHLALAAALACLAGHATAGPDCLDAHAVVLPTGGDLWPYLRGPAVNTDPLGCVLYHTVLEPGSSLVNRAGVNVPLYTEAYGNPTWNWLNVRGSLINESGAVLVNAGLIQLAYPRDLMTNSDALLRNDASGRIDNYGTLRLDGLGGTFQNQGLVHNHVGAVMDLRGDPRFLSAPQLALGGGEIVNEGRLTLPGLVLGNPAANGTLTLMQQGTLVDTPVTIDYFFTQLNEGSWLNTQSLTIRGSLLNTGTLVSTALMGLEDLGSLTNTGTLTLGNAAGQAGQYDSTLFNSGLITNSADMRILGNARLAMGSFAAPDGTRSGLLVNEGTLTVEGALESWTRLRNTNVLTVTGVLTNMGELHNEGPAARLVIGDSPGIWEPVASRLSSTGLIVNTGTILIAGNGLLEVGGLPDANGVVSGHLQNDGLITVNGRLDVWGSLHNSLTVNVAGVLTNNGELWNQGGAWLILQGGSNLISSGRVLNDGKIANSGFVHISDSEFVINGRFENFGDGYVLVSGNATLSGSGAYTQHAGRLVLDGVMDLQGGLVIEGGELCGHGSISNSVTAKQARFCSVDALGNPNATLAGQARALAADAPGGAVLSIGGDLNLLDGGVLTFDIGGNAAGSFTHLVLGGALVLVGHGSLHLNFIGGYLPTLGTQWALLSAANPDALAALDLVVQGLPEGYGFAFDGQGGIGVSSAPVPEPASRLLWPLGLLAIVALRRKKEAA